MAESGEMTLTYEYRGVLAQPGWYAHPETTYWYGPACPTYWDAAKFRSPRSEEDHSWFIGVQVRSVTPWEDLENDD